MTDGEKSKGRIQGLWCVERIKTVMPKKREKMSSVYSAVMFDRAPNRAVEMGFKNLDFTFRNL